MNIEDTDKDVEMQVHETIHQPRNKSFIESVYGAGRWFRAVVGGSVTGDVDICDRRITSTPSLNGKNVEFEANWNPDFAVRRGCPIRRYSDRRAE